MMKDAYYKGRDAGRKVLNDHHAEEEADKARTKKFESESHRYRKKPVVRFMLDTEVRGS